MQNWGKWGEKMGFFSSTLGKQRLGEEKESKQTTIQAFPFSWPGSSSSHHLLGSHIQTEKPAQLSPHTKATTKRLSYVKM